MDNLEICIGIDDAIRLLAKLRQRVAGGSHAIWSILNRAGEHLEREMKDRLAE